MRKISTPLYAAAAALFVVQLEGAAWADETPSRRIQASPSTEVNSGVRRADSVPRVPTDAIENAEQLKEAIQRKPVVRTTPEEPAINKPQPRTMPFHGGQIEQIELKREPVEPTQPDISPDQQKVAPDRMTIEPRRSAVERIETDQAFRPGEPQRVGTPMQPPKQESSSSHGAPQQAVPSMDATRRISPDRLEKEATMDAELGLIETPGSGADMRSPGSYDRSAGEAAGSSGNADRTRGTGSTTGSDSGTGLDSNELRRLSRSGLLQTEEDEARDIVRQMNIPPEIRENVPLKDLLEATGIIQKSGGNPADPEWWNDFDNKLRQTHGIPGDALPDSTPEELMRALGRIQEVGREDDKGNTELWNDTASLSPEDFVKKWGNFGGSGGTGGGTGGGSGGTGGGTGGGNGTSSGSGTTSGSTSTQGSLPGSGSGSGSSSGSSGGSGTGSGSSTGSGTGGGTGSGSGSGSGPGPGGDSDDSGPEITVYVPTSDGQYVDQNGNYYTKDSDGNYIPTGQNQNNNNTSTSGTNDGNSGSSTSSSNSGSDDDDDKDKSTSSTPHPDADMSASCPDILCGSRRDDPVRSQAIDPEFKKSTLTNPGNAGVETGTVTKKLDPDLANERLNPYIIPDDNAGMPGGSSSVPSGQLDSLRGGDPIGPDVDGMGGNILKPQPSGSGGDPRM